MATKPGWLKRFRMPAWLRSWLGYDMTEEERRELSDFMKIW